LRVRDGGEIEGSLKREMERKKGERREARGFWLPSAISALLGVRDGGEIEGSLKREVGRNKGERREVRGFQLPSAISALLGVRWKGRRRRDFSNFLPDFNSLDVVPSISGLP
jgi:hypothetical protein